MTELISRLLGHSSSSQHSSQHSSDHNGNMPFHQNGGMPSYQNTNMPYHQNTSMPYHHNVNMPYHQNVNVPYHQNPSMPPYQNASIPSHQNINMPHHQNPSVPPHQNNSMPSQTGPQTFTFKTSFRQKDMTSIYQQGANTNSPPLYSVATSIKSKPNVTLYRGEPAPHNSIGKAIVHSSSSKTDLEFQGQSLKMKTSSMSGNHTVDSPRLGKLKWVVSQFGGSSLELRDDAGTRLAKYGSASFMGDKQLEIFVPCDDYFIGLVLLSAMACSVLNKIEKKVAMEMLGAV